MGNFVLLKIAIRFAQHYGSVIVQQTACRRSIASKLGTRSMRIYAKHFGKIKYRRSQTAIGIVSMGNNMRRSAIRRLRSCITRQYRRNRNCAMQSHDFKPRDKNIGAIDSRKNIGGKMRSIYSRKLLQKLRRRDIRQKNTKSRRRKLSESIIDDCEI